MNGCRRTAGGWPIGAGARGESRQNRDGNLQDTGIRTMMRCSIFLVLLLAGCGGEPEPPAGKHGHVWQEQINTMDKARDVDSLVQDSAAAQRQAIDAQAQ
jgi:hypothetical protein